MADTAAIWVKTRELKERADAVYADLEGDGDLTLLNNGLAGIRDEAERIRLVVSQIDDVLDEL